MSTALDLIRDALTLTNSVGTDQTLTADEADDGLRAFNDLLEDWSLQNIAVFGQANQTFNTVSGTSVYTIGTGGAWNTTRPVRINDQAYSVVNGVSFPCLSMTQDEYNAIPVKTQTQEFPDRFLYVNVYPLGLVTLWPVPSAITPVTFSIDRVLSSISTLATVLSFPPGYRNAFVLALGLTLAPSYGKRVRDYPELVEQANTALGNIKRANKKVRLMRCDPAYSDPVGGWVPWQRGY